jgi:hypothetical protein
MRTKSLVQMWLVQMWLFHTHASRIRKWRPELSSIPVESVSFKKGVHLGLTKQFVSNGESYCK